MGNKLTKRTDNYSSWYNEVVSKADLAEHSEVRGCMVIKPHGFAIWEKIQRRLDERFKEIDNPLTKVEGLPRFYGFLFHAPVEAVHGCQHVLHFSTNAFVRNQQSHIGPIFWRIIEAKDVGSEFVEIELTGVFAFFNFGHDDCCFVVGF